MTTIRSIPFMLMLAVGLAWPAPGAAQHEHSAHEHGPDALTLELDDGRRWQTDASLREGMQRIRSALDAAHAGPAGRPDAEAAAGRALASAIDDAIGYMVANCRLSPEADANLHVLLGQLGQASAALKQDPTAPQAVDTVVATLELYGRYFDHPGWGPIRDAH